MGRPKLADPPKECHISLPRSLVNKVELLLFSTIENRVPHGGWSRFTEAAIRFFLEHPEGFRKLTQEHTNGTDSGTSSTAGADPNQDPQRHLD